MINLQAMGEIVRLRYRLMWAKTRFRSGRVTLFAIGCFLLAMVLAVLGAGGISAGVLAVKSGRALIVSEAVLGGLYSEALFAATLLGFGLNTVFTDLQLRRYPITAAERFLMRHLIGLADPFWLLAVAIEIGFAISVYVLGDFHFLPILAAVLLQLISNYLLARIIGLGIDRIVSRNAGFIFLTILIVVMAAVPAALTGAFRGSVDPLLRVLRWTPPFAAAACVTKNTTHIIQGFAVLTAWLIGLAAFLSLMERLQPLTHAAITNQIAWNNMFDRLGSALSPRDGPLIAFWLRFYWRNNRLRAMYALSLPITSILTYEFGNRLGRVVASPGEFPENKMFLVALGAIYTLPFLAMSRFAVNQFGYLGGGFRRLLLMPTEPWASLRAGNYASMLVGGALIPVALTLWILFGGPFDARKVAMLLGSATSGLFIEHAAGLWLTLYGPRKLSYNSAAGNDMSLLGNVVVMGSSACALFAPHILAKRWPGAVTPENWWGILPLTTLAILFYAYSLRTVESRFVGKREALLAALEGKAK